MSWFAQVFRPSRRSDKPSLVASIESKVSASFADVEELISDVQRDTQKGMRRLGISQRQQMDAVEQIAAQVSSIGSLLQQDRALVLDLEETLALLDDLDRIKRSSQSPDLALQLVEILTNKTCQAAGLTPICQTGEPYPQSDCEVVGAVADPTLAEGHVKDITEQGYRSSFGVTVRTGKVVVSSTSGESDS